VPRVAGHGVGCALATSFARVWVARGRARAGRNSGWEMPREGCREDVCGCGCENPRGVAGVGHAARRSTLSVHLATDLFSPSWCGGELASGMRQMRNRKEKRRAVLVDSNPRCTVPLYFTLCKT